MNSGPCRKLQTLKEMTIPQYGARVEKTAYARHNYPEQHAPIDCRNGLRILLWWDTTRQPPVMQSCANASGSG